MTGVQTCALPISFRLGAGRSVAGAGVRSWGVAAVRYPGQLGGIPGAGGRGGSGLLDRKSVV